MDHAVILAGGSGTRLWPMSRRRRPKQLLPLVGGRSLLELALERLAAGFAPERTWIVTSEALADPVRHVARHLPAGNVLGEPAMRDTSNAIGLACLLLARRDPDAKLGIFTADHVIRPTDRFLAVVRDALALLDTYPDAIVTLGVKPTWPHTGLGYIHRGQPLTDGFFAVERFVEKPDQATAERYLGAGQYYWNSGMFLWRATTAIDALTRFRPDHVAMLRGVADAWDAGNTKAVADGYAMLPRISIDYALMEPASTSPGCRVVVRELDCEWVDLGSWPVLTEINPTDGAGNLAVGRTVAVDASGSIIINEDPAHLLAAIGVRDVVIVRSGDVTLVAPKSRAADLKKLIEQVRLQYPGQYE